MPDAKTDGAILARLRGEAAEDRAPEKCSYRLTDAGNAEFYADEYGGEVRYDHRRGLYFVWNGNLWIADCDGALTRFAVRCARKRGMAAFAEGERV